MCKEHKRKMNEWMNEWMHELETYLSVAAWFVGELAWNLARHSWWRRLGRFWRWSLFVLVKIHGNRPRGRRLDDRSVVHGKPTHCNMKKIYGTRRWNPCVNQTSRSLIQQRQEEFSYKWQCTWLEESNKRKWKPSRNHGALWAFSWPFEFLLRVWARFLQLSPRVYDHSQEHCLASPCWQGLVVGCVGWMPLTSSPSRCRS